jgi:predicted 3-demethylubiquinone-9 3-methyltransferase (glyoxalase superfamily)
MTGIHKKCPYCKHKYFIPVQIIVKNETITIAEPYIACEACLEQFKIELQFKTIKLNDNERFGV